MGEPNATDADPAVLLGRQFTSAVVIFHEAVGQLLGLSGVERKCLDILDRLGTVSAGRIAEHTGLTTGAVTGMIDRLTRAGYVERIPNPADRRSPAQLATIADWVARTTEVLHRRTEALTASAARTQPGAGSRPERAAGEPRTTRGGAASSVAG
jgi:DNA-binding MarR family transcriptional regulator